MLLDSKKIHTTLLSSSLASISLSRHSIGSLFSGVVCQPASLIGSMPLLMFWFCSHSLAVESCASMVDGNVVPSFLKDGCYSPQWSSFLLKSLAFHYKVYIAFHCCVLPILWWQTLINNGNAHFVTSSHSSMTHMHFLMLTKNSTTQIC